MDFWKTADTNVIASIQNYRHNLCEVIQNSEKYASLQLNKEYEEKKCKKEVCLCNIKWKYIMCIRNGSANEYIISNWKRASEWVRVFFILYKSKSEPTKYVKTHTFAFKIVQNSKYYWKQQNIILSVRTKFMQNILAISVPKKIY